MEQLVQIGGHESGPFRTHRRDRWWVEPLWTGAGFAAFALYTTAVVFWGNYYYVEPYLSPMFSPPLFVDPSRPGAIPLEHAWIGLLPQPAWLPDWVPLTPAWFILIFPLTFRLTCYYYRKFYYRAYFASPPGCAVGPVPQKNYRGERGLLIVQNLHRYMLYFGIAFIVVLTYDAYLAYFKAGKFGVGVGSLILTVNPILLGTWTFGCHAFRHLVGGRHDTLSGHPVQLWLWKRVSWLNARHMKFAWISMMWVWGADLYVRLVALGIIRDLNTWG